MSFDPSQYNFNFPLPGETGPAVMVKMYTEDVPRIAQMIEVCWTSTSGCTFLQSLTCSTHNFIAPS